MNEQELREMVRESIARQRGESGVPRRSAAERLSDAALPRRSSAEQLSEGGSAAFLRLPLVSGGDQDGNCIIEPAVRCNHCGYCQSFGH